ncbi:MAG: glycoside hydrolase family 25 domain-containing protein [Acidimicrobiales bacterium]
MRRLQLPLSDRLPWRAILGGAAILAALALLTSIDVVPDAAAGILPGTSSTTTTTAVAQKPTSVPAYYTVASDGGVFAFGGLPFEGSMGGKHLNEPMVGIASTPDAKGYWTVASDGGIFAFGDARFQGSMGGQHLNAPVVAMAPDPATGGYWLVASDGGIFAFDAPFFGSMGGHPLNAPVVGIASTSDDQGYWLFASDGGVFAFGDAQFHGSMGGKQLSKPIVGGASPDVGGYWELASDGGIFAFGDAAYEGSLGGQPLVHPMVSMAEADPGGYWLTDDNGAVTAFGDAGYFGSAPQQLNAPMVGITDGPGNGSFAGSPYQSGAYGYDISNYQCGQTMPSGHAVGIVKAYQSGYPNNCLGQEAAWAGAGLNLYIYMVGGTQTANEPSCSGTYDTSCNFGYAEALAGFQYAKSVSGVNPDVAWWLDVETDPSWSSNTAANAAVVAGAITALRDEGINNVGVYTSPNEWNTIVGNYQPPINLWMAWWTGNGPYDCQNAASYAQSHNDLLPTGPLFVVQYTDQANGQSLDGDYAC